MRKKAISLVSCIIMITTALGVAMESDYGSTGATVTPDSNGGGGGNEYLGNTGYEPWFNYIGGVVNPANGNLYLSKKDISINARGFDMEIIRSYNSLNSNLSSGFGFGWTFNYNTYLDDKSGYVYWADGDGSFHNFTHVGSGNYSSPPGIYSRLNKNSDNTFTLWFKNGGKYNFDTGGILQNITDRNENSLTFTYSGQKLMSIADDSGLQLNLSYNAQNRISSVEDPLGRQIGYEYDSYQNLVRVTDAMGNSTRYIYYCCHDLATVVDPVSSAVTFSYFEDSGRLRLISASFYDESNQIHKNPFMLYFVWYDFANDTVYYLNPDNYASAVKINDAGNSEELINAYRQRTLIDWVDNEVINYTDANGNVYRYEYDPYGNLIKETDPFGHETLYKWNNTDTSEKYLSLLTNITEVAYEPGTKGTVFNDTMESGVSGWTASTNWSQWTTESHSPVTSWNCGGGDYGDLWDETLDSPSIDMSGYVDAELSFWHKGDFQDDTALHDGGNVKVSTDGGKNWTLMTPYGGYDGKLLYGNNNSLEVERAFGYSFDWRKETFDLSAYVGMASDVTIRFEMGTDKHSTTDKGWNVDDVLITAHSAVPRYITTKFYYDEKGNLIQAQDATGNSSYYDYDGYGNLINVTDFRGYSILYNYNTYGNMVSITDPTGNVTGFDHDFAGRQISVTDANGYTTTNVYDDNDRIVKEIDAAGNETRYTYNANGALTSMTDANGHQTNYSNNLLGEVDRITDATGNTTYYTYTRNGGLVETTDSEGNSLGKEYDRLGRPTAVRDELGRTEYFGYDAVGNIIWVLDKRGYVTHYEYNKLNRLTRVIDPLNAEVVYKYDEFGNVINVTDENGHSTVSEYDDLKRRVRLVKGLPSLNVEERFSYDANGNLKTRTDGNNHTTTFEYDSLNRNTRIIDPRGNSTRYTYDAIGNLKSLTDRNGHSTTYDYDALNREMRITDATGNATLMTYDAVGNVLTVTNARGYTTTHSYDSLNRLVTLTDALGNVASFTYDTVGNVLSMTDPNGNTYSYSYDAMNRITKITDPLGHETRYEYDYVGNVVKTTDANGNFVQSWYDAVNRLVMTGNPMVGNNVWYAYDKKGNVISITDGNGNAMRYKYDSLDQMIEVTSPLGPLTRYSFDASGNVETRTDANGNGSTIGCDELNRIVHIAYPIGNVTFTYDAEGNILEARNDGVGLNDTTYYQYDALDRPISVKVDYGIFNKTIEYEYDEVGNRKRMKDPEGGSTTYGYDALDRLTRVTDPSGRNTTFTYDAGGRRVQVNYPNGVQTAYTYDSADHILNVQTSNSSTILLNFGYTYDKVGNRLTMTDKASNLTTYIYDGIYRLTDVFYPSGKTVQYTYDLVSNRISETINATLTIWYTYDADNRLITDGTASYLYDANGNLISKTIGSSTTTYQYDYENRLVQVILPNSTTVNYRYSPFGDRLAKSIGNATTYFLYDHYDVLAEYNASGVRTAEYVHGHVISPDFDEPISINRSGNKAYYHLDSLGSVVLLTNATGSLINFYSYEAFGDVVFEFEAILNTHKFTAKEYDKIIGLYFYRSRYYDAIAGRFVVKDPFGIVDGINLYVYVGDNPVNFVDPCGRKRTRSWVRPTMKVNGRKHNGKWYNSGWHDKQSNLGKEAKKAWDQFLKDLEKCGDDVKRIGNLRNSLNDSIQDFQRAQRRSRFRIIRACVGIGITLAGLATGNPVFTYLGISYTVHSVAMDTADSVDVGGIASGAAGAGTSYAGATGSASSSLSNTVGVLGAVADGLQIAGELWEMGGRDDAIREMRNALDRLRSIDLNQMYDDCCDAAYEKYKDALNEAKKKKQVITHLGKSSEKPQPEPAEEEPEPAPKPVPPPVPTGGKKDEEPEPDKEGQPPRHTGPITPSPGQSTGGTTVSTPWPHPEIKEIPPPPMDHPPIPLSGPGNDPGGGGGFPMPAPPAFCEYRIAYFGSRPIDDIGENHKALYNAIKWAARHGQSTITKILIMPSWGGYEGWSQWQSFASNYSDIIIDRWSDMENERVTVTFSGLKVKDADVLIDSDHYSATQQGGYYTPQEIGSIEKYLQDEHGYVVTHGTLGNNTGQESQTTLLLDLMGLSKTEGDPNNYNNNNPWTFDVPAHSILFGISTGWDPGKVTGNVDIGRPPIGSGRVATKVAHLRSSTGDHHTVISAFTLWFAPLSPDGLLNAGGGECVVVPNTVYFGNRVVDNVGNNHDVLYNAIKWVAKHDANSTTTVLIMPGWGGYLGWSQWQSFAAGHSDLNVIRWSNSSGSRNAVTTHGLEATDADVLVDSNHSSPSQQGGFYAIGELQTIEWYVKQRGYGYIATYGTLGEHTQQANQTEKLLELLGLNKTNGLVDYQNNNTWIIDQPYHPIIYGISTWDPGRVVGNVDVEDAIKIAHLYSTQGNCHSLISADEGYGKGGCACVCDGRPQAGFSYGPTTPPPKEGDPIQFNDTSSDGDGYIVNWSWDFGDGTTSNEQNPVHTYGDNGNYTVTLTVTDNNGNTGTYSTVVVLANSPPSVTVTQVQTFVNITLRVAGEKWHNVEMYLFENGSQTGYVEVTRYPGSPDDQSATISDVEYNGSKAINATVIYTPDDDPVNGQIFGASPCWIILRYRDGSNMTLNHTFNVQHPASWVWNVSLNPYLAAHGLTFVATATDPGSDDLTFAWNWGDGSPVESKIYYNDGTGPDPYPSPWGTYPFTAVDVRTHAYPAAGSYTLRLRVTDDDGGLTELLVTIVVI